MIPMEVQDTPMGYAGGQAPLTQKKIMKCQMVPIDHLNLNKPMSRPRRMFKSSIVTDLRLQIDIFLKNSYVIN